MDIIIGLHIATLLLSIGLFVAHFVFVVKESPYAEHSGLIKARRVADLLVIMLIALVCWLSGRVPFIDTVMTEKAMALMAYAFMVFMALQSGKNVFFRSFSFVGGIGWLFYGYSLAVYGQAYLLK